MGTMARIIVGLLLVVISPVLFADAPNIYRDIDKDVSGNQKQAHRLKLKPHKDLSIGRVAGVWGGVGQDDEGDAFFLGKTPDRVRMRFTLGCPNGKAAVQLTVLAKDGQKIIKHQMLAQAGQQTEQWFELKGTVTVEIMSPSQEATLYAAYFWYPGERLDGLDHDSFVKLKSGSAGEITSFVRRKKGDEQHR